MIYRIEILSEFFQILSKADSLEAIHSYTGQQKIVHDFACLLEGHMQGIPEDSWHQFQIDCLNLVHHYRHCELCKQPLQPPLMTWPAPHLSLPPPQQQQFWRQPPNAPIAPCLATPSQSPIDSTLDAIPVSTVCTPPLLEPCKFQASLTRYRWHISVAGPWVPQQVLSPSPFLTQRNWTHLQTNWNPLVVDTWTAQQESERLLHSLLFFMLINVILKHLCFS